MTTETTIFKTTAPLRKYGYVSFIEIIIPREIRKEHGLIEGDMLDITITRSENDDQDTKPTAELTRLDKIKYLKNCGDVIELPDGCWRLV